MRYISWVLHKVWIRCFIFFVMGIFLGMFFYLSLHGKQIDALITENEKLKNELRETKADLEVLQLEKKIKSKNQLIRSVQFHIQEKLDGFIEAELLEVLIDETYFLVGKKVEDIGEAPEMIYQLLNNKDFTAGKRQYNVKVKIIYVGPTTRIWISAQEHK
ncbi:hypothetical protein [Tepidibacillus fermentans]|uniref:Sporulation membrane protein YtrI C-terminal domain-containing protein n=1 Tax=Tepidibacillus fermentans TaxID=1281767 RepID=A0A4R3KLC4_9BACI|nr:hypothetical protein [Tepidibacillus fermentans]TCS83590.1 hypothetical protein EDD72_104145 [Tepidibacillus fermentans]